MDNNKNKGLGGPFLLCYNNTCLTNVDIEMNERIRELWNQSRYPSGRSHDEEKFAELILQDCIKILQNWKQEPFPFDEDVAVNLIKEHFKIG